MEHAGAQPCDCTLWRQPVYSGTLGHSNLCPCLAPETSNRVSPRLTHTWLWQCTAHLTTVNTVSMRDSHPRNKGELCFWLSWSCNSWMMSESLKPRRETKTGRPWLPARRWDGLHCCPGPSSAGSLVSKQKRPSACGLKFPETVTPQIFASQQTQLSDLASK